jgi:hypothetical protein
VEADPAPASVLAEPAGREPVREASVRVDRVADWDRATAGVVLPAAAEATAVHVPLSDRANAGGRQRVAGVAGNARSLVYSDDRRVTVMR